MSRFAPVTLGRSLDNRVSATLLRHYSSCPRSGYLYAKYRGEGRADAMVRGEAFHRVAELATKAMIDAGESTIPSELVKAIVNEVLSEVPVPFSEHDYLRECAWRWAAEWAIDPSRVICAETLLALQLGDWQVRGRVDFAELREGGGGVYIADFKTARAAPAYEDIARKRPDGTLAAKQLPLVLYALMLAFGQPIRLEPGPEGEAVEVLDPFPLAGRAGMFDLELIFPGIEDREGRMLRRPVSLTRPELLEYQESLRGLLARLGESEDSGDWPAIITDEGCKECPASGECPIPRELREHRGTINSMAQAREAAEVLDRRRAEDNAMRKELKAFAEAHGEIRYGADKAMRFGYTEQQRIADREAMFDAVERAVNFGESFERERYVQTVRSTPFGAVRLSADELDAEALAWAHASEGD